MKIKIGNTDMSCLSLNKYTFEKKNKRTPLTKEKLIIKNTLIIVQFQA